MSSNLESEKSNKSPRRSSNRYDAIISKIFWNHYATGLREFEFDRAEFEEVAKALLIVLPKNLGDVLYSFRFRKELPEEITAAAPDGYEWNIELAGQSKYRFKAVKLVRIVPNEDYIAVKIPDATPEIISKYAQTDEQALLAKVRYNRLIDLFLGIAAYSLQSHLRTTVEGMGQIEIDEIYVGVNKHGTQFVIPVQAKGGADKLGAVQCKQDIACCATKFPDAICRSIAVQFMGDGAIAMFELAFSDGELKIVEERHYRLVLSDAISSEDLEQYRIFEGREKTPPIA